MRIITCVIHVHVWVLIALNPLHVLANGIDAEGSLRGSRKDATTSANETLVHRALNPRQSSRVIDYPPNGISLGQGWDSSYGNRRDTVGIVFEKRVSSRGQIKTEEYSKAADKSSLMQALDISTEFQYKGLSGGVSGKFKFATKTQMSSTSQSFVARAKVENGKDYTAPAVDDSADDPVNSVRLTPHALNLAQSNMQEFQRIYGDSFVSAIHTGAELYATLTFEEQERESIKNLEASMSGSAWGFSGSGSFKSTVNEYSQSNKLKVHYYQAGGAGDPIPLNIDGFLAKIQNLPTLAQADPHPYSITVQRYDTLPNWPQRVLPEQSSLRKKVINRYFEYTTLIEDIADIERHPKDFLFKRGTDLTQLQNVKQNLHTRIHALEGHIQRDNISEYVFQGQYYSDYYFRMYMPIPYNYHDAVSYLMSSNLLRWYIKDFWLKQASDNRCKFRGYSDEGCLSPQSLAHFESSIPITAPPELQTLNIYNGRWGAWKPWVNIVTDYPDFDSYRGCGAQIRLEKSQGSGDDTGANGLKLMFCDLDSWDIKTEITVYPGNWGTWRNWVMCPKGTYIAGAQVRFENSQGSGDDTALNGLRILCKSPHNSWSSWQTVSSGYWGSWKSAVQAKPGLFLAGASVRYEDPIRKGDDTAWNGLQMKFVG